MIQGAPRFQFGVVAGEVAADGGQQIVARVGIVAVVGVLRAPLPVKFGRNSLSINSRRRISRSTRPVMA